MATAPSAPGLSAFAIAVARVSCLAAVLLSAYVPAVSSDSSVEDRKNAPVRAVALWFSQSNCHGLAPFICVSWMAV